MVNIDYELKIRIVLKEKSDIGFWKTEKQQNWLKSDLAHMFDISDKYISINLKEITNYKEIYKFLTQIAQEYSEKVE